MIKIGVICPSEIALRRFVPALKELPQLNFAGVAVASQTEWPEANQMTMKTEKEKANEFISCFGGRIYDSYSSIIQAGDIDALYIPLPPALHYSWAKHALHAGKHVLLEKPATTSFTSTKELVDLAKSRKLALHENYMFAFHSQLTAIDDIIRSGEIGDVRLYRVSFGFPRRVDNDFRYNKSLGGGALLDAGGYTIKYATMLLGDSTKLVYAQSQFIDEFEVDISGSAALVNENGVSAQVAFGMDNSYKCDLEVWGSKGVLHTDRVLTAPVGFTPEVSIKTGSETERRKLPKDDAFLKSIRHFQSCMDDDDSRMVNYDEIIRQAQLVQQFIELAKL